jgi:hypothetical protein
MHDNNLICSHRVSLIEYINIVGWIHKLYAGVGMQLPSQYGVSSYFVLIASVY